jgi:23S rRNA (adenine2503-C2)-methyltransferase
MSMDDRGLQPWDAAAPEAAGSERILLPGQDRAALRALAQSMGQPAFRGDQVFEGLYRHRYEAWEAFTALPKAFRARLEQETRISAMEIVESHPSADGSTKHAFRLADGHLIEGVHMPHILRGSALRALPPAPPRPGQAEPAQDFPAPMKDSLHSAGADVDRVTLCLSSQVGCAMGCTFCATGQMGILRNLGAGEILGQVIAMLNHHQHPAGRPVNLVFMGMGEPLHNLDHLMAAFRILVDETAFAIPPRRITVSTSGLVSGIGRMAAFDPRPRLALSLNATTDTARSRIMPVNRVWGLAALAEALKGFPLERRERITLEFVLLKGVTDSLEDGQRLAAFAQGFPAKVNLIPFNPHEGAGFEPPDESRIEALCAVLVKAGVPVSVRRSRGQDIAGACGQLVRGGRGPA